MVLASLCDDVSLPSGDSEVIVQASFTWYPLGLLLAPAAGPFEDVDQVDLRSTVDDLSPISTSVLSRSDPRDPATVDLGSAAAARTVVLAAPVGAGWEAAAVGGALTSVTVDGWAQGWVVPTGVGNVTFRYAPGQNLGGSVGGAAVAWALVVLLAAAGSGVSRGRSARRTR